MTRGARAVLLLAAGLAATAALPFAARALRGAPPPRCVVDGVPLAGAPVVRVSEDGGGERAFCCVSCAEAWLDVPGRAAVRITVTDAVTGAPIEAAKAWFVRSRVEAQPATGDRVLAFGSKEDAIRHAEAYHGRLLSGNERPFHGKVATGRGGE